MELLVKRLQETAKIPAYAYEIDAGMDLYSAEAVSLAPGERAVISTGVAMAIPVGFVGLIWDKSGVATKRGLKVLGGVIDSGYRGEVKVGLVNHSDTTQAFAAGDRIAQMLIQKVEHPVLIEVEELSETARDEGGFGSTGET